MRVVPIYDRGEFFTHLPEVQRYENTSEAFALQRPDEPLDDGNAAVLADCPETRPDLATFAPAFERLTPELAALVTDDALGLGTSFADRSWQGEHP